MAKLKAPLLSLGASGQLAKTLVFFPWKGLNAVREYVIPSNPRTSLQLAQRAHVTTMVAAIHTAQALAANPMVEVDQVAYSALSQAKGLIMTWFNMAVKLGIDCLVASKGVTVYRNGYTTHTEKEDFRPNVELSDDAVTQIANGKFWLGTSKTNLIHSVVADIVTGDTARCLVGEGFTDLVAGTKYYWQFRPDSGDPCAGADSGIYHNVAT